MDLALHPHVETQPLESMVPKEDFLDLYTSTSVEQEYGAVGTDYTLSALDPSTSIHDDHPKIAFNSHYTDIYGLKNLRIGRIYLSRMGMLNLKTTWVLVVMVRF